MKTCKKLPGGWSRVHALVAVAAVSLVAAVSVGSFFKDGGSALKAAVAVPSGYTDQLWFMITFPSGATNPLTTVNHASTGDTLTVSYTSTDKNADGKVDNLDCAGANGPIVYWATYRGGDGASKPVTFISDSAGKCILSSYALTTTAGTPLKLALTSKEISPTTYAGTPGFIKYATSASPVTEWNGIVPTIEVVITSTYGQCDYGKYWDTATNSCITQPSCGNGWWDSATNACVYNTCYTDTWASSKPECGPSDTDYTNCRDPYYWYNKSTSVFEKCTPSLIKNGGTTDDFCNTTTGHTTCQSVKADRVALLELAFATDPAVKTEWLSSNWPSMWWEPMWDSTAPYKKYDPATDALVACSNTATTTGTWSSGTFYANCQPVPAKWEAWYLKKWRGDYADWKKMNSSTTCDGDKVCEPGAGETMSNCPADCGSTATACDYDKFCDSGETTASCPGDCSSTGTIPSDWKEVVWNTLGLKSYVSINTPQDVIDAAKTACADTKPEYATWPNPSDFTKPATVGVPSCTGTVTPLPVTPPPIPMPIWTTPIQTGCSSTDASCIDSGKSGAASGWCYSGMSCYNSDKTKKYCQPWSYNSGSSSTCPTDFPKQCGPYDSSTSPCIEPGATGSESGWCMSSMECFIDGKKFCQPWDNSGSDPYNYKPTTCPAGSKQCPSSDPSCIEPGGIGKVTGWCKNGSECFNKEGTEKFCLSWDMNPNGYEACPATHPKACRPGDTDCIEIGATGPSTGWCAMGGKQCYVDAGISCVSWEQSCPAGAKACRPGDSGCVEPGTTVDIKSNDWSKWCASSSVSCYATGKMTCVTVDNTDMFAWEKVTCPAGFGRCRADDTYCIELGETGPSGSWCASGMSRWNTDGTVTCVSGKDWNNPDPDPEVCLFVQTSGYDADSGKCKVFADSCLPEGWVAMPADKVCKDGKVVEIADSKLEDLYYEYQKYLEDIQLQVRYLPENSSVKSVNALIDEGFKKIYEVKKLFADTSKKGRDAVKTILEEFRTNYKDKIDALVSGDVQPYIELNLLRGELKDALKAWNAELSRIDTDTEYFAKLSDGVKRVKQLMQQAEGQQEVNALRQMLTAIKTAKEEVYTLVGDRRAGQKGDFMKEAVEEFTASLARIGGFIKENEEDLADDYKIGFVFSRFEEDVQALQTVYGDGDEKTVLSLIEGLTFTRQQLRDWLAPYGYRFDEKKLSLDRILEHVDEALTERFNALTEKLTNKFQALLDDRIQEMMVKVAEVVEKFSEEFASKITTAVDNLTYIANETIRTEVTEAKNEIIARVSAIEDAIAAGDVPIFTADGLRALIERIATVTWCGNYAEDVQAYINTAGLALEAGEFDSDDLRELEAAMPSMEENNRECYDTNVSDFWDLPVHEWYFGPIEYNYNSGFIKGYSDAGGEPTGECGPANATLRIEALAMDMRLLGIPEGDRAQLAYDVPGVPEWGYGYINGARDAGVDFDWSLRFDQPITRVEAMKLMTDMLVDKGFVQLPDTYDNAANYKDFDQFSGDKDGVKAIEAMTDLGVIKGSTDGNVYPYSTLLRSEFAAINQRVSEIVGGGSLIVD